MKKRTKLLLICLLVLTVCVFWIAWGNTALELNTYTLSLSQLPRAFDGYRIVHVSDLHNAEIGENNERLLAAMRKAEPDMIVMTGDMIDSRRTDFGVTLDFAAEAVQIAPCYYVPGNHEARISEYVSFKISLQAAGVTLLENEQVSISASDASLMVLGVSDPSFSSGTISDDSAVMDDALTAFSRDAEDFTILLSHRPELYETYVNHKINLVFTGHAHGGQFRLPFVGGLIAPNQGLFPEYDSGLYTSGNTNMLVSRGIGNSAFPFRFNNRPEVILIELRCP